MESFFRTLVWSNEWKWRVGRHAAFWACWITYNTIVYSAFGLRPGFPENLSPWTKSFIEALLFTPAHMILSYLILYVLFPKFLYRGRYLLMIAGIIGAMIIATSISYFTSEQIVRLFRKSIGVKVPELTFLFGLMSGLRGATLASGFAAAIKLVKHWTEKKEENARLEKEMLNAELALLKNQLQPHFLFNTLNSLYNQTLHQPHQAPDTVLRLSELLRYMLAQTKQSVVPLSEEVNFIRNYIALEQGRYGDRLDLDLTVTGILDGRCVAPLILLPFVENAFKHGVSNNPEPAWLTIEVVVGPEELKFTVVNGKPPAGVREVISHGLGLENTQRRLQMLYPDRHQLKYFDEEDSFAVILRMPLEALPAAPSTNGVPASVQIFNPNPYEYRSPALPDRG